MQGLGLATLSIGIMVAIGTTKPQVQNPELYFPYFVQYVAHILVSSLHQTGNHADFHQFVGSRPYVYYYHLWLIEIPPLSFLPVPQLSCTVFRISMGNNSKEDDIEESSTSFTASDEVSSIVSPPPAVLVARRKIAASSTSTTLGQEARNTSTTSGQEARKMSLLESHLKTVEKIQYDAVAQRKKKDERDVRLALTVELKTVEEMLVMKKCELKDFDANVDSDPDRDFVCQQITKLRKKQRSLMAQVYASDDDEDE